MHRKEIHVGVGVGVGVMVNIQAVVHMYVEQATNYVQCHQLNSITSLPNNKNKKQTK